MIGTGNAFAKNYFNNNALIESVQEKILIDCGTTLPFALYQQGFSFNDLDGVIVSHIHADHIGGLEIYAYQMKYQYKRIPKLYIANNLLDILWHNSLKGGLQQTDDETIHDYFNVIPLEPNKDYTIASGLNIKLIPTRHIPNRSSYSLLLNESFFYSADCIFERDLLLELHEQKVHTFYHDCQFSEPGTVHTTLSELKTLPISLQKKIKLMHYADNMMDYINEVSPMSFVKQGERVHIAP